MANGKKAPTINDNTEVTVINNFAGKLFYRSPRTQDEWEWSEYGDEHEMTIAELKTMKAQARTFFDQNWIIFADKDYDAIPHLKLEKYYKNIVTPEQIEALFEGTDSEMVTTIQQASTNVKDLIFMKAKEKYEDGSLRDVHMIDAIEKTLGVEIDLSKLK